MIQRQTKVEAEEIPVPPYRYVISSELAEQTGRALAAMVASRRCYTSQQADEKEPSPTADVQPYIDRIVEHCRQTPDYLLPDTPLKEAIFRVMLSNGNRAMTATEISQILSEKWAMTAYPRDISPSVILRLLDNMESYCVVRLPQEETQGESQ